MAKKHFGKFLAGAALGAGLGVLFAPKSGKESRKDLASKINELIDYLKTIDADDVKEYVEEKISQIKSELKDLDKEKALKVAKEKGKELLDKCDDLVDYAKEKGTPYLKKAANDVREKTISVLEDTIKKLESNNKKNN